MADNALALIVERINRSGSNVRITSDSPGYTNSIQVKSETTNALYVVSQRKSDGVWCCGCRGWIAHRRCKHLQAMLPALSSLPKPQAEEAQAKPARKPARRLGGRS